MDIDWILKYLEIGDLEGNSGFFEIAEISGMDVAKTLLKNHATLANVYIPNVQSNNRLMRKIINDNINKLSIREIASKTGLSRRAVEKYLSNDD